MGDAQTNRLWLDLSSFGDGNIFASLPELMQKVLFCDANKDFQTELDEEFDIVFPSDDAWQAKIYYKLVEKQRKADATKDEQMFETLETPEKLHDWNLGAIEEISPIITDSSELAKYGTTNNDARWTIEDIVKAGNIISGPTEDTDFEDEQEMRRVYTLIYNVFRYKNILNHALNEIAFFFDFPELSDHLNLVWLLLFDLNQRNFKARGVADRKVADGFFKDTILDTIESCIWKRRIKLAASISRLRIENRALSLNELLPNGCTEERCTTDCDKYPVTCWLNLSQIQNRNKLHKCIEQTMHVTFTDKDELVSPSFFKNDAHCPCVLVFHSSLRGPLARNTLVKENKLIIQDKSFCIGPTIFTRILDELGLTGNVIQSHINSPRVTAYLANLLSLNKKIHNVLVFGAGARKQEYEDYFVKIGISNIQVYSERLIDISLESSYLEEVIAVFVTPPNSYSAVVDPIDLVCSRGGDLSMLQALTEVDDTKEGRKRAQVILEEQRKTLKFSMSRPQFQMILYETHSQLDVENKIMVEQTVSDTNRVARIHHAKLKSKLPEKKDFQIKEGMTFDDFLAKIEVPDTDIFDTIEINQVESEDCENLEPPNEGCYLALIQRKSIIKLDNKYMIQMAENRGLFGGQDNNDKDKPTVKRRAKRVSISSDKVRKITELEIARIAQPTHTFLQHCKGHGEVLKCTCHHHHEDTSEYKYKRWWVEASRHLAMLKKTVDKNKLNTSRSTNKSVTSDDSKYQDKIDEYAAKSRLVQKPIGPRLKLTRSRITKSNKTPLPLTKVFYPAEN